ncbi:MAG: PrsW family intramembrane metalloprotease [Cytophagales bacterium]|nr:PrsW family intramembrane metalloprotease [Cytophagales bacterium]
MPFATLRLSFLVVVVSVVVTAVCVNNFLKDRVFDKLHEKAAHELKSNRIKLAEKTLYQIVLQDSLSTDVENHYRYIETHFLLPEVERISKYKSKIRDDSTILNFYRSLALSPNEHIADIGLYGEGLINTNFKRYKKAVETFLRVRNSKLKYLNNSIGYAYRQLDSIQKAEIYFKREIDYKGNVGGAYHNLANLLFAQSRIGELKKIIENDEAGKYIPANITRLVSFKTFQPVQYGRYVLHHAFSSLNVWGFVAACLVMVVWVVYIRRIDVFEPEKWKHMIFVLFLGMISCFFTLPVSDFLSVFLGFELNGRLLNDFFYCVIAIGSVEELVKAVPLLLILKYADFVDEPFDYISYASLSALGFAFVENISYFDDSNLHSIHGRALTATVMHMVCSSIIAYGFILNRYKRRRNPYFNFFIFFVIASAAHGFYDFWIIAESVQMLSIISMLLLVVGTYAWNSFKNNALNHSSFFDKKKSIEKAGMEDYLLYSLTTILLFEYVAFGFKFGPEAANSTLAGSVSLVFLFIVFVFGSLSKFSLVQGEWAPIRFKEAEGKVNYDKVLDERIQMYPFTNNEYAYQYLPNTGMLYKRLVVSDEPDWYIVKLDNAKYLASYLADFVLIRTKDKEVMMEDFKNRRETLVAFNLIPENVDLENDNLQRVDFVFCGWASVEYVLDKN